MKSSPACGRGASIRLAGASFVAVCLAAQAQTPGSISMRPASLPNNSLAMADMSGNLYGAGLSTAGQYPVTAGAAQTQPGGGICPLPPPQSGTAPCTDAYIVKSDAAGKVLFATYLGGPKGDGPSALAVDPAGEVFVVGGSGGALPTTPNTALVSLPQGGAFAAKLSADGSRFLYATYLPTSMAQAFALAIDAQGNVYIAGVSGSGHIEILKLSADGGTFLYTRELKGSAQDVVTAIAVDAAGDAIVTGWTNSPDFPVSADALQTTLPGTQSAIVTKLDPAGAILFSTYLGGSASEIGYAVATDGAGNVYVGGAATSPDFPTTAGTFEPAPIVPLWGSGPGGFIAKLSADGGALLYGSYAMGHSGVTALAVDAVGNVYLAGLTGPGFPVTQSAPQPCFGGVFLDSYLVHLNAQGRLQDATNFGLTNASGTGFLVLATDGSVWTVASATARVVVHVQFGGTGWSAARCVTPAVLNAASLATDGTLAPGQISSLVGFGMGPASGVSYTPGPAGEAPFSLAGVEVFFDDQPAPLLYVQSNQINLIAPFELAAGKTYTMVLVVYNNTSFGPFAQAVNFAAPTFFRLQPELSTQAAAINQDGAINSAANPARVGSWISIYGTGFGETDPACATGVLNPPAATRLAANTAVQIGTYYIQYAGGAPNLLCGVVQVNMYIPENALAGGLTVSPIETLSTPGSYSFKTAYLPQFFATIMVK